MANNQLLASDNFASGSLAAGWSAAAGGLTCKVVGSGSSAVTEVNSANVLAGQVWTGLVFPNDQISELTIGALTSEAGTYIFPCVRYQVGLNSGYAAYLVGGNAELYLQNNGTNTQLAVVTGLTISAGDVWALQAAGACISLWQNYNRILYFYDTTFASGSPGFLQLTGTASHSQVSSWRGYSCVQKDGIWQKQGIVVPALIGDLDAATPGQGIQTYGNILHEGNAQLLSGTVYKMWIDSNIASSSNIFYAESLDGIAWTRSASPVLANFGNPFVFKNGATYYLYCQPATSSGTGNVAVYTSTNGVNWTVQNTNCIGLGGAGTWDHASIYPFAAIAVINGTWYALYAGTNNLSTYLFSTGLATSTDGINWTKYPSNPVLANVLPACLTQVGSTFYMWAQANQPGRGNASAPDLDPIESVRYKSVDMINWTQPTHSVHNSQLFESLNTNTGNCVGGAIINGPSGNAFLYTNSAPSDAIAPYVQQISLSIGPTSIAGIVTQNEDAAQQIAADNFTSGTGNLSANWTTPTGGTALKIVAGPYVEPTATSTVCQAVYTGASFGKSQYSSVTLQALTGTLAQSLIWPTVLSSTTALTNYEGRVASPTATSDAAAAIYKRVAGTPTQIGPTATCEPEVGDVWTLSVFTGSDGFPVLSLFQNGFLILQVQDQSTTPLISGNPGIQAYSSVAIGDAQISLWAGGNANVIPTYPSLGSASWLTVAAANMLRGSRSH